MTKIWSIKSGVDGQSEHAIHEAAVWIQEGKIVAFPTETVYGLGADATNHEAVERIFTAKGRPSDNPLIVHIATYAQLMELVTYIPPEYERIMECIWPGPLTLVFPVVPGIFSTRVTAGLNTVAIRIPSHPIALRLLEEANCPIAAPSANLSGKPSPTSASHVYHDLNGKIDGILDGGETLVGLESTVLACIDHNIHILRPGGVTLEDLQAIQPHIQIVKAYDQHLLSHETPKSPGMKYSHYAPNAFLQIISGKSNEHVSRYISQQLKEAEHRGEKTGVMTFEETNYLYDANLVLSYGKLSDPTRIALNLYAHLRRFDEEGITYILAEACPEDGIGSAIMNRLRKAAGNRIIQLD
jgi:L-threonylcarbamoyladenylate synthase